MKLRSRMTGVALVAALSTFGLAACGSDDEGSDNNDNDSSSTESESTDDAGSGDDEASGGKPSKEDVIAGFSSAFTEQSQGQIPPELVDGIVTCLIDDIYDDLSDESATALAEGSVVTEPEDQQLVANSISTCTTEALTN